MRRLAGTVVAALLAFATACSAPASGRKVPHREAIRAPSAGTAEAISLLGRPLHPPEPSPEFRAQQEARLAEARAALDANPGDPDARIWVGRRMAYLGRYRESIAIYTEGIARHPEDARMLRHRGHRFITVRQLERAVEDLARAAALREGLPDEIEPDGLPNARNVPTSTLHSNIYYHLGLAHFLSGDFAAAERAYRACLRFSGNPDMLSATTYWLYLTRRRRGDATGAATLLEPIHAGMDIIENHAYHRLLLMYRGEIEPATLLADARSAGGVELATLGYGVGSHHLHRGDRERAIEIFREVLDGGTWAAFGHIAAEAELARLRPPVGGHGR